MDEPLGESGHDDNEEDDLEGDVEQLELSILVGSLRSGDEIGLFFNFLISLIFSLSSGSLITLSVLKNLNFKAGFARLHGKQ